MASLVSSGEKAALSGVFDDVFDTFKRDITIYKEPIKTLNSISEANIFGYGDASNQLNYTYTSETGVFPALIKYSDEQQENYYSDLAGGISKGDVRIKVKKDCRDFIEGGKTEKVEFDDKTWNVTSEDSVRRFLDSEFFVYYLTRTK
tara:strand:+ start:183 stop:623 length:441 start_codon:yes stop_codon:yes gene_type:complete